MILSTNFYTINAFPAKDQAYTVLAPSLHSPLPKLLWFEYLQLSFQTSEIFLGEGAWYSVKN